MSRELPTPPVPDLARAKGRTVPELAEWFVDFFNHGGAPFNFRRAAKSVRAAYKGIHQIHLLTAGCSAEKTAIWPAPGLDDTDLSESGSALEFHWA